MPVSTLTVPGTITITFTGDATTTQADWDFVMQSLSFLPSTNDVHNPNETDRNFTFQVQDSQGNFSNTTNSLIHVVAQNDLPTLDLDDDDSSGINSGNYQGTFIEDGGPVPIHSNMVIADLDDTNLESAQVILTNPQTDDQMLINGVVVNAGDTGTLTALPIRSARAAAAN